MPINYKLYHPKWKRISYFIRKYRAKWHCEWCRAENHQPHPVTGKKVVLTVAHLDHNIQNNSLLNLAALCQKCHLGHDRKDNIRRKRQNKLKKTKQLSLIS